MTDRLTDSTSGEVWGEAGCQSDAGAVPALVGEELLADAGRGGCGACDARHEVEVVCTDAALGGVQEVAVVSRATVPRTVPRSTSSRQRPGHAQTTTKQQTRLAALCPGLPGWAGTPERYNQSGFY